MARPRRAQVGLGASVRAQVLLRKVDPITGGVLADILQVLDDLQRDAHVIGQRDARGRAHLEDPQHELSDRRGGQSAVGDEVLEGLVADHRLVTPIRLDQTVKGFERKIEPPDRRGQALQERMRGPTRGGELELAGEPIEQDESVASSLVADVVGQPGEAVHGEQMVPDRTRQEPRGHRKILSARLPQHRLGAGQRIWSQHRNALWRQ